MPSCPCCNQGKAHMTVFNFFPGLTWFFFAELVSKLCLSHPPKNFHFESVSDGRKNPFFLSSQHSWRIEKNLIITSFLWSSPFSSRVFVSFAAQQQNFEWICVTLLLDVYVLSFTFSSTNIFPLKPFLQLGETFKLSVWVVILEQNF